MFALILNIFNLRDLTVNLFSRGTYFQEGSEVKLEMRVEQAHHRSIETVLQWIQNTVNTSKTQVFFRTFAPVHFRYLL